MKLVFGLSNKPCNCNYCTQYYLNHPHTYLTKSATIEQSNKITRYVEWGLLQICFAAKLVIATFTNEIS